MMVDHGYINFYTPLEFEPYQQYQQHPYEEERVSNMENILNMFIQQSMINMQDTNQRLKNLSFQLEMMQAQIMVIQANNQSTHGEQENIPTRDEKVGEIVEEGVDETAEDIMLEGCGTMKTMEELEPPHEIELLQERSYTEEANTVDNGQVMMGNDYLARKNHMNKKG